jgi:nucleoid-associated protein YgaU
MPNLDQLKQKYQPVIDAIQKEGGQLQNVNLDGNQLYVKATMPNEQSKNRVWDAIKMVDPTYSDLKHDIEVKEGGQSAQATGSGQSTGQQTYTVQPGDSLSKISKQFYGDANKYNTIAQANNIADPDKIKPGQKLTIPKAA